MHYPVTTYVTKQTYQHQLMKGVYQLDKATKVSSLSVYVCVVVW